MAEATLSYSPSSEGWTSRWSYIPDWMIGMNSNFYTWKNGCLYLHDSNHVRNNFYESNNPSTITTIFNQDALTTKLFKTISLDSNATWDVVAFSDLENGIIDKAYFQDKEGGWFAYIRRENGIIDTRSLSTQGIGSMLSILSNVLTFSFNIGTSISVGDTLYKVVAGALVEIGTVTAHDARTITVGGLINAPAATDVIVFTKDSQAESYGIRGYFMEVELENNDTTDVELFSVGSSVFKSNP